MNAQEAIELLRENDTIIENSRGYEVYRCVGNPVSNEIADLIQSLQAENEKMFATVLEVRSEKELLQYRIEKLESENLELKIKACTLVKAACYEGFGEPNVIDGKCSGYAGHMDEPHEKCQECEIGVWEGVE